MRQNDQEAQLARLRERYGRRNKTGRSRMLDELCEQYGYSRKHAIKLLRDALPEPSGQAPPGPEPRYAALREIVVPVWQAAEQLCGKRLVAALPLWLPHFPKHHGPLLPSQKKLLRDISAATLDRLLAPERARVALRGLCGTKPGSLLRTQIPLTGEQWDESRLGHLEADSVAHCGSSLAGNFIWSLTYTDLPSQWTAGRAVFNKGAAGVLEATQDVEARLPFAILGFDFDNGNEWLNWPLVRHFQERARPVRLTRSRPYHKDDNAHVEQKNWMWPRQLLGYDRLEDPASVPLINALYREVWEPLQNFFLPSMKLVAKRREGSRIVRQHDRAQTAYQRLLASGQLETKAARRLREQYAALDPFELARQVDERLRPILRTVPT